MTAQLRSDKGGGYHVLSITSDTITDLEVVTFLKAPDQYLAEVRPDIVITTPAVPSGLSIESTYFDEVIGLHAGVVTSANFMQMLGRVRPASTWHYCYIGVGKAADLIVDPKRIQNLNYQQYIHKFSENFWFRDKKTARYKPGKFSVDIDNKQVIVQANKSYFRFERLVAGLEALDNQLYLAPSQSIGVLMDYEFEVTVHYHSYTLSKSDKDRLRIEQKKHDDARKVDKVARLGGENTLNKEDYHRLSQRRASLTAKERDSLKRYTIAQDLGLEIIAEKDIDFHEAGGTEVMERYELLKEKQSSLQALDKAEVESGISLLKLSGRVETQRILVFLVDYLGLDLTTGEGRYDQSKAILARQALLADEQLTNFVETHYKLKVKSSLADIAFINKLLKKLLLLKTRNQQVERKSDKVRIREYFLSPDSVERLNRYASTREVNRLDVSHPHPSLAPFLVHENPTMDSKSVSLQVLQEQRQVIHCLDTVVNMWKSFLPCLLALLDRGRRLLQQPSLSSLLDIEPSPTLPPILDPISYPIPPH